MTVMHTEEIQIVIKILIIITVGSIENCPPGQAKKMYGGSAKDYAPGQRKKYYRYDD